MFKALLGGGAVAATAAVLAPESASADTGANMTVDTLTVTQTLTSTGRIIASDNAGNPSIQAQTVYVDTFSAEEIGIMNGNAREFSAEYFSADQITLRPQQSARPASGLAGELYVDPHARLWFCKGGNRWVQLA